MRRATWSWSLPQKEHFCLMATGDEATDEYRRPGCYDPVSGKWRQMVVWLTPGVRAISSTVASNVRGF